MRRRLSYANVVATLALVLSMTGGALAAKHYLINSTNQINPKVLKKLKGNAGPKGAAGAPGAAGTPGGTGATGPAGAPAGGFVSSTTGSPALESTSVNVMKLSEGTGKITAPAAGKLLVNTDGNFQKHNTSGSSDALCWISLSTNGGGFTVVSPTMIREFTTQFENQALSTTAGASVAAGGVYDVALTCNSFNPEVKFVRGDLTAVFVAG